MTNIVPFLLEELKGESALIIATTLWTLQKFSSWTARETDAASFATYMNAILLQTQATDPNIQESACTSLSTTFQTLASLDNSEELISTKLQPLVLPILTNFAGVLDRYQGASLIALFDCVATLAEVLGQKLRQREIVDILIPLLSRKWQ